MTPDEKPSLLIFSSKVDIATDHVILKLENRGAKFFRINAEDFPMETRANFRPTAGPELQWLGTKGAAIDFSEVKSVWFRRHRLSAMPAEMEKAHQEYALREADWFVKGIIYSLDDPDRGVRWMNHPGRAQFAESKIYQLTVAKRLGLCVPQTLISNDPTAIRHFWKGTDGNAIAKPLRLGYFDFGDRQTCVFTTQVSEADLVEDEPLKVAPVIYQRLIRKAYDIRVTVVGTEIFAAAIDSQSIPSAVVDWRQSQTADLPHSVHKLPDEIRNKCLSYMRALGLSFGAIDLILTPGGEYVFLEINSSGQWVWLEDRLRFPISEAIADWLWQATNH
jgi:glutathione synthase/RimK-type ligase-like ATP-grasp enzyme